MDAIATLIVISVVVTALLGIDLAAVTRGVDSRTPIGDDHRR